jgi:hypothetical protein
VSTASGLAAAEVASAQNARPPLAGVETAPSRTLFLSMPAGHHVADLARGPFLRTLVNARPRPRIVVLSPFASDPHLVSELERHDIRCVAVSASPPGLAARVIDSILSERFLLDSGLQAVRIQRDRARLMETWRGRRTLIGLKAAVCRLPVSRRAWFQVAQWVTDVSAYRTLFETHRPALLVTATAGFLPIEMPLIYAAKRFGVPQMGVDLGWDNLSSKYHTVLPVDYLAVWNDTMRDEAVRYHGFRADRVEVTGAVPFDGYFGDEPIPTRDDLCRSVGADPARPVVTLATAPAQVYPTTDKVVEILARAVEDGALDAGVQLLVRVHPRDHADLYSRFHDGRRVFVEKPFQQLERSPGAPELDSFTPGSEGRRRLAATLAHSDVIVNFASTTTVEASLFDTPVVNIGFDDTADLPLPLSIARYYQFEHYRPVVETGAAHIATSPADLVRAVALYLNDPRTHAVGRRALARKCCAFTDGRAGERLGDWVLDTLRSVLPVGAPS